MVFCFKEKINYICMYLSSAIFYIIGYSKIFLYFWICKDKVEQAEIPVMTKSMRIVAKNRNGEEEVPGAVIKDVIFLKLPWPLCLDIDPLMVSF